MAGSLKTAFFNLVKYAANDITSWLTDFNGNMDKIDAAMNQNKQAAATAQDGVDNMRAEYESLLVVVNGHTTSIDAVEKGVQANTTAVEALEKDVNAIQIGNQKNGNKNNGNVVEALLTGFNLLLQQLGNGSNMSGIVFLSTGTLHTYDRQINSTVFNGYYCTDLMRFTGNFYNLNDNVWSFANCLFINSHANYIVGVCYLPESNYTVVGLCRSTETSIALSANDIGIIY